MANTNKKISVLQLFAILMLVAVSSCGKDEKDNSSAEATDENTLADKPNYASGSCEGEVGCIKGFISHGMRLTLTPEGSSKDAFGEDLEKKTYEFRDAQDFGDRFDTAFLKPLVPAESLDQYEFKIAPSVKRDNFAAGFELYSEGLEANDDKVTMEGEGNFQLGDLSPYDDFALRAVKTFRIEITKKPDAEAGIPDIERAITCLELDVLIEDLEVKAGEAAGVGGLRNFKFYYTESDEYCKENKVGQAQPRDIEASALPSTDPNIP